MAFPRVPAVERMTAARWTALARDWPGGRAAVTDRAGLVAAVAAGTPVTVSDGATLTGADVDLPAGADVRAASYLGANVNFNLRVTGVADVVVAGLRMGSGFSILLDGATRGRVLWCLVGGGGTADYGVRATSCTDTHLVGNVTRRQRVYGQSVEGGSGNSIRQARWDTIGRTPPVLDGVTECGLNFASHGVVSGGEGFGSAWAEVRVADSGAPGGGVVEDLRVEGRIGVDVSQAAGVRFHHLRVAASLYGLHAEPGHPGQLGGCVVEDVLVVGGTYGLNLEECAGPTVQRVAARDQSSACIRQRAGAIILDLASCDLVPAPGGVPFRFDP